MSSQPSGLPSPRPERGTSAFCSGACCRADSLVRVGRPMTRRTRAHPHTLIPIRWSRSLTAMNSHLLRSPSLRSQSLHSEDTSVAGGLSPVPPRGGTALPNVHDDVKHERVSTRRSSPRPSQPVLCCPSSDLARELTLCVTSPSPQTPSLHPEVASLPPLSPAPSADSPDRKTSKKKKSSSRFKPPTEW